VEGCLPRRVTYFGYIMVCGARVVVKEEEALTPEGPGVGSG
jgi:hypothetical protein